MSIVWDNLISIQNRLIDKFELTGTEIQEEGMERFNQPGWINRVWSGDLYRRAHVDVVDMRLSKIVELIKGPKDTLVLLKVRPIESPTTTKTVKIRIRTVAIRYSCNFPPCILRRFPPVLLI